MSAGRKAQRGVSAVGSGEIWRYRHVDRVRARGLRGKRSKVRSGAAQTGAAAGARSAGAHRRDRSDARPISGAHRGQPLPGSLRSRRARRGRPPRTDRRRSGDALPPPAGERLRAASVDGRTYSYQALGVLLGQDEVALRGRIQVGGPIRPLRRRQPVRRYRLLVGGAGIPATGARESPNPSPHAAPAPCHARDRRRSRVRTRRRRRRARAARPSARRSIGAAGEGEGGRPRGGGVVPRRRSFAPAREDCGLRSAGRGGGGSRFVPCRARPAGEPRRLVDKRPLGGGAAPRREAAGIRDGGPFARNCPLDPVRSARQRRPFGEWITRAPAPRSGGGRRRDSARDARRGVGARGRFPARREPRVRQPRPRDTARFCRRSRASTEARKSRSRTGSSGERARATRRRLLVAGAPAVPVANSTR